MTTSHLNYDGKSSIHQEPSVESSPQVSRQKPTSCFKYRCHYPSKALGAVLLFVLLSLSLVTCSSPKREELEPDNAPTLPSTRPPLSSFAVESDGGLVYLGVGPRLLILDARTPEQIRPVSELELSGTVRRIRKSSDTLAVACGEAGFSLIDVSQPENPVLLSSRETEDRAEGIFVTDTLVYVAARSAGILIYDIRKPTEPIPVGVLQTVEESIDVLESNGLLFVAANFGGVLVADVTEPSNPVEIGFADRGAYDQGYSWAVAAAGHYVFSANVEIGLRVVDVSDPKEPRTLSIYPLLNAPASLTVQGSRLLVADQQAGLRILDVSDPRNPKEESELTLPGRVLDISVSGSLAFIAAKDGGLRVVDISDPHHPQEVGAHIPSKNAEGIVTEGSLGVTFDSLSGIHLLDLGTGSPRHIGSLWVYANDIALKNGFLYVALKQNSFQVYSVSDPSSPELVSETNLPGPGLDVALLNDTALIASGPTGLLVVDISSPDSLQMRSRLPVVSLSSFSADTFDSPITETSVWGVAAEGGYAYLATNQGMSIVDISSLDAPREADFLATGERVSHITVNRGITYLSCDDGLRTVKVDGEAAQVLGYYDSPSFLLDTIVRGGWAFLADHQSGVIVVDITEPAKPMEVARVALPDRPLQLSLLGDLLFVATGAGGLQRVDVSNPPQSLLIERLNP